MAYHKSELSVMNSICNSNASADLLGGFRFKSCKELLRILQVVSCETCDDYHVIMVPEVNGYIHLAGSKQSWSSEFKAYMDSVSCLPVHEQVAELLKDEPYWSQVDGILDEYLDNVGGYLDRLCSENKAKRGEIAISCAKHRTFHRFNSGGLIESQLRANKLTPNQIRSRLLGSGFPKVMSNLIEDYFACVHEEMFGKFKTLSNGGHNAMLYVNGVIGRPSVKDTFIVPLSEKYKEYLMLAQGHWSEEAHELAEELGLSHGHSGKADLTGSAVKAFNSTGGLILQAHELEEDELLYWIGCFRKVRHDDIASAEAHLLQAQDKIIYACNYGEHYHVGAVHDTGERMSQQHVENMHKIWERSPRKSNIFAGRILLGLG